MCEHHPACPSPDSPDRAAARVREAFPGQGWSLLCNGVVAFDDAGAILPDRRVTQPGATEPVRLAEPALRAAPIARTRTVLLAHAA